ncbi:MAG: hypothetical protein IPK82_40915 [Polyangiaceae bacterium]|nr:hypothetical protein [Polyangiaceae bacterium]
MNRRLRLSLVAATAFACVGAQSSWARADDVGVGVLFYGLGSFANIHNLTLNVGSNSVEADPVHGKNLRLDGGGHLFGAGMQVTGYFEEGIRGGINLGVFGMEGAKLNHDRLDSGFRVRAEGGWGVNLDGFVGYEILHGAFRPYIDMVGQFSTVGLQVDLLHPDFGRLGRSDYNAWKFGFGPRVGASIPLGDTAFLDFSGTYSIVGMERFRVMGGIGFWSR